MRAGCVLLLQCDGIDEELHAKVLVDSCFAFGFGEAAQGVDVVGLDAVEVVFGLGVLHAEDSVGVGFAVDVRDAPVVADDGDVGCFSASSVLSRRSSAAWSSEEEKETKIRTRIKFCSNGDCS